MKSRKAGYPAHLAISDWQVRTYCAKFNEGITYGGAADISYLPELILVAVGNKDLNISFTKQDVYFVRSFLAGNDATIRRINKCKMLI